MRRTRVIIELSPSVLEVSVFRGRAVVSHRRIVQDRAEWPTPWTVALEEMRAPLIKAVTELGCLGAEATIIYNLPGAVVGVHACPLAAGRNAAVRASRLALTSLAPFSLGENPSSVRVLYADRADAPADGGARRVHTVAAADADATVSAVSDWCASAGLNVASVVPLEAAATAAAVDAALVRAGRKSDAGAVRALLWIGSGLSVLVVTRGGRLELVRTIGIGTESLAEALLRPIRGREGSDLVQLDRAGARRLLAEVGVPTASQDVPGLNGCTGASLLPLLQPVLQRLAVEVKQSLRFGVSEAARAGMELAVIGEGAEIGNLDAVIGRQAGLTVSTMAAVKDEPRRLSEGAAALGESLVCLLGSRASEELMSKGLRRSLVAGVAAASMLLAIQGVSVYASLAKERERLAAIRAGAEGAGALAGVQERAMSAASATASLRNRVEAGMGSTPDWSTVLGVIAERTPDSMRILDASMSAEAPGPSCTLRGYVRMNETGDAAVEIRRFVDALSREPIVEGVRLGVTQRSSVRGVDAQTFVLNIALVGLPASAVERTLGAAGGAAQGSRP